MITISVKLTFSNYQGKETSLHIHWSEPRRIFNPWRVLKVVVLTALSLERILRDLSVLKGKLFQGLWGDPRRALVPVAGDGGGSLRESTGYF